MLERVSPQAECAAHIFLRRLDTPIRSHRSLGPSFWKHGNEPIGTSSWWPSYLDSIRKNHHDVSYPSHIKPTTISSTSITYQHRKSKTTRTNARTFTGSSQQGQVAHAQEATDLSESQPAKAEQLPLPDTTSSNIFASGNTDKVKLARESYWHRKASWKAKQATEKRDDIERAWNEFVITGCDGRKASSIIHILVQGGTEADLDRVLRAFNYIPEGQHVSKDYQTAVDASIHLNRYSTTIQLIDSAVSQSLGYDLVFKFLAHCISKDLWNTAADFWKQVCQDKDQPFRQANHVTESKKQNFAGKHISHFDSVSDLPSRIISLATRLANKDPSMAARWSTLVELCRLFALTAVESENVMGIISSNGVLSLLAVQEQLGFDDKMHFAALATLSRMSDVATRSQLAIHIYRNFKYVNPSSKIPKWVFGTMIDICSAGKQSPGFYQLFLDDYKAAYKHPDHGIYLRILRACASQAQVDDVYVIFEDFCKHSKPEHADDLNPLIRVHAVVGDYDRARQQFDRIRTEFGFTPSIRNWNALILASSRSGNNKKVYEIFEEMNRNCVKADQYTWTMMAAVASKKGDTKQAQGLLNQARAAGISPPLAMIGTVVDSHLLNRRPEDAWSLVVDSTIALRKGNKARESPVRLWNSLFRYYAFQADSKAILRTQEKMKELNVKADGMTYAALMTALVVQRRTQDAAQILRTLHFSQSLSATEFHYSILIHGFAMERKREQAQVFYNELLERFSRPNVSVKLAMLYLQANRDEESARANYLAGRSNLKPNFQSTLKTIKETLADVTPSDIVSSFPTPGFGRRSAHKDLEQVFFGSLIKFLHRNQAYSASDKVLKILNAGQGSLRANGSDVKSSWISLLDASTQQMEIAVNANDWDKVTEIWSEIINIALENCTASRTDKKLQARQSPMAENDHNIELPGSAQSGFSSMLPQPQPLLKEPLNAVSKKILPAHSYALSRPISQYIKALDKQRKHAEIINTIQTLRAYGFSLSSKNWNFLIQVLCKSSNHSHQMLAYELFDQFLLPSAPSWDLIRRGKWIEPSEERPRTKWEKLSKVRDDRKNRKTLEKLRPDLLMPSYYTMINLAIVWQRVSRAFQQGDHVPRQQLESRTPGTVKLVLRTPYLKDRVQGVLLRGLQVIGDRTKRPRQSSKSIDSAGVQRSQFLIDHVAPDTVAYLETIAMSHVEPTEVEKLSIAETLMGQIAEFQMIAPSKGRFETLAERRHRITRERLRRSRLIDRLVSHIREDLLHTPSLMGTVKRGQTSFHSQPIPSSYGKRNSVMNQRSSQIYRKLASILRTTGDKALHEATARSARRQKTLVRTTSITQRQLVSMLLPPPEEPQLIARPSRKAQEPTLNLRARRIKRQARVPRRKLNASLSGTHAYRARLRGLKFLQTLASSLKRRHDALRLKLIGQTSTSRQAMEELERRKSLAEKAATRVLRASKTLHVHKHQKV